MRSSPGKRENIVKAGGHKIQIARQLYWGASARPLKVCRTSCCVLRVSPPISRTFRAAPPPLPIIVRAVDPLHADAFVITSDVIGNHDLPGLEPAPRFYVALR
jgi:hypothetical protein